MTLRSWHASARSTAAAVRTFWFLSLLLPAAGAMAGDRDAAFPAPADLGAVAAQAAKRGTPIIILFSLPGCSFCDVIRQNYLAPLARDVVPSQRPIIREVGIMDTATFFGFHGEAVSHSELARKYGVRFAPTVILLDRAGNLLAPPIIGGDVAGLYGAYLGNALAEASHKLVAVRLSDSKRTGL